MQDKTDSSKNTPIVFTEQGLDIKNVKIILPDIHSSKGAYKSGRILYKSADGERPLCIIVKQLYSPFGAGDYNNDKKFSIYFNLKKHNAVTEKLESFLHSLEKKIWHKLAGQDDILDWLKIKTKTKKGKVKDIEAITNDIAEYKWNGVIKHKEDYCNTLKAKLQIRRDNVMTQYKENDNMIPLTLDNISDTLKGKRYYNVLFDISNMYLLSSSGGIRVAVKKLFSVFNEKEDENEWTALSS